MELEEKPQTETALERLRIPERWLAAHECNSIAKPYLANMGIYLCRREWLLEILHSDEPMVDIVHDVLPKVLNQGRVRAHVFNGYWEDLGTVRSYYDANLALVEDNPAFDFHSPLGVIYTRARNLPAARLSKARIDRSIISDGCVVGQGAIVNHSLLGVCARIGANAHICDSLILALIATNRPRKSKPT